MQKRYKGLSNIGATCYMNSLLQTLFMTPQFRYGIYKWKYNQKIHPKETDSIIFQLQKLFGKLQTDFPNEVTTKQLVKSFQWEDQEAQMQQDIQEFNRLLFQALQKSLSTKSQKYIHENFVKQYFEGQLIHYTKCHQCQNQSSRQEFFQDVIVTVKNIYQKVYNKNLELGIQRYLKPEILDQNNLYDCSNCGKKTKAERGARFIKMPSLLNIIFQRFNFNYFTMERQKINDSVQFPFILNFNDYIHGYEQIPNKLNEDSSDYFKHSNVNGMNGKSHSSKFNSQSNNTVKKPTVQKKSTIPSVAGKTKTKPSAITKGFLAEMRKRKNMHGQQNEDLFFVNGTTVAPDHQANNNNQTQQKQQILNKKEISIKQQKISQTKQQPIVCQNGLSSHKPTEQNNLPKINGLPIPPPLNIIPNEISAPYKRVEGQIQTIESQLQKKKLQSQKLDKQKQQQLSTLKLKNKEKIEKYLQQGPLVYELYAVLVHNGTANHGHYYSYIKSYEDQKWYCFNDDRVTLINVLQIEKTFGNGNSNAYALYYKLIQSSDQNKGKQFINQLKQSIPAYIKQKLDIQKALMKQKQQNKMQNLQNIIVLKIYYQLYAKQLEVYKSNTLELVLQKVRQIFNISPQIQRKNIRLRIFNAVSETKLDTFGGRQHLSLQQLKIGSYKSLLLQIKKDQQQFQEYQVGVVSLRLAFIEQNKNLNSLDQMYLRLHKISIKKNLTIKEIISLIKDKRKQLFASLNSQNQEICLIKRHQNNDETIHEIISISDNQSKSMDDLTILENQILFVQANEENLMWPVEFDNQVYRICIKYNKPSTLQFQTYLTDSRITVEALKNELCLFLQVNPEEIMMKLGTKSGRQLKDLSLTLKQSRFITGTQIYFDFGIPAKTGEIRIMLFLATDASANIFNRLHEFQYLTDVPISGNLKASQVKQKFIKVLKKLKDIQLKPQQFRIRQRVSDKIGKIYRQRPMKEQQLIEKRQIAIERIPDQNLDMKQFSIYFRIWDQQNWQLSKRIQLVVNKSTTVKQLAQILSVDENNKILKQPSQMCICRILSIHKFNIIDLTQMEWFSMEQQAPVIGQPMFVNADGLLYIVKNGNSTLRQLTKQEQKKFGGTVKAAVIRNKPKSYQPKQAKSMKIKVIQKQCQSEQLTQKNQQMQEQVLQQKSDMKQQNPQKQ